VAVVVVQKKRKEKENCFVLFCFVFWRQKQKGKKTCLFWTLIHENFRADAPAPKRKFSKGC